MTIYLQYVEKNTLKNLFMSHCNKMRGSWQ